MGPPPEPTSCGRTGTGGHLTLFASAIFASAIFLSAALLFTVQMMVAKMLLPLLGGSPSVWNTCLVFFQGTLFLGYLYAHFVSTRAPLALQLGLQALLIAGALLFLPVRIDSLTPLGNAPALAQHPVIWQLRLLAGSVGLPFFVLSVTAPLLQTWFRRAAGGHSDPYLLYAGSNAGSLIGLLAYPALIEPELGLREQAVYWTALFILFALLCMGCGLALRRKSNPGEFPRGRSLDTAPLIAEPAGFSARWLWVFLAFVPSSLMMGLTTYTTTEVASVPLLWVIPLALYLATYIIAFGGKLAAHWSRLNRVFPAIVVAMLFILVSESRQPVALVFACHWLFFFVAALLCHLRLAGAKPAPGQLTEFFLCVALGGLLGGIFNALVAPQIFSSVLEYPLVVILSCLACLPPRSDSKPVFRGIDPAGLLLIGSLAWLSSAWLARNHSARPWIVFFGMGLPLLIAFLFSARRLPFVLALATVLVASHRRERVDGITLLSRRNFFGTVRISVDYDSRFRRLHHGSAIHGMQFLDPRRKGEPLAYYHRTGPARQVVGAVTTDSGAENIAVVGLGTGAMAAYARAGQRWTFYEIDPLIISIARNPAWFVHLARATNATIRLVPGDARLRLRESLPGEFNLIVLDAFSSDLPPLHLLTREALQLYRSKLAPGGLIAYHISNRHLDFAPVLARLAADAGLECDSFPDLEIDEEAERQGKLPSHWVVLAQRSQALARLRKNPGWKRAAADFHLPVWTDDYSNILRVWTW